MTAKIAGILLLLALSACGGREPRTAHAEAIRSEQDEADFKEPK